VLITITPFILEVDAGGHADHNPQKAREEKTRKPENQTRPDQISSNKGRREH
jgi:hypothetical protein